jgi:4-oxalomesaconate hydratase
MLVFSAHAADFVWRAGGTIALHASRGYRVRILCLSFGERGESQGAWKELAMVVERVKEIRRAESERAAGLLGAEVRFFDAGDYLRRAHASRLENWDSTCTACARCSRGSASSGETDG